MSKEITAKLQQLTEGMLYISESDQELDVQEWSKQDKAGIVKKVQESTGDGITEQEAKTFFDKTINALDPSDELGAELAKQYKELYQYLSGTFKEVYVLRSGETEVHIYIVCLAEDGDCYVLHTVSVET